MSEATIIAKILWYTGNLSLQRLAMFLEISVGAVKNIIISVNFRRDNRHDPEAGRFGFPTEPDFTQKS